MKAVLKIILIYILQMESRLVLYKYKPKIIAITGSVGKTSTKDAIFAVLSTFFYVRKSEKSYNSEIGLPLTILGCENGWNNPVIWLQNIFKGLWLIIAPHKYPKWLVLEVGIGKQGDMRRTASWLRTDIVVMTAIGETPVHVEFFDSRKHLIEEKSKLIKTLKNSGVLILNADDEDVLAMKTLGRRPVTGEAKTKYFVRTYGFTNEADILCSGDNIFYNDKGVPEGLIFRIDEEGSSFPVVIEGVFGRNHVYASLGALSVASSLKLNMLTAINALKHYDVPPGRMRLLKGIEDTLIIDDTYNSSPLACEAALKTLGGVKSQGLSTQAGRRIAVLGDMLELGRHTLEAHKNIGKIAKGNADVLVVVGPRAKTIKEGAIEAGMNEADTFEFLDSYKVAEFIKTFINKYDIILVKGSQSMRMERVVDAILLDQGNKKKLLVRQNDEWLNKK